MEFGEQKGADGNVWLMELYSEIANFQRMQIIISKNVAENLIIGMVLYSLGMPLKPHYESYC